MVSYPCLIVGILTAWFYYQWMEVKWKYEKCHRGYGSSSSDSYGSPMMGSSSGGSSSPKKEKHSNYEFWTWVWTVLIFFAVMYMCQSSGTSSAVSF